LEFDIGSLLEVVFDFLGATQAVKAAIAAYAQMVPGDGKT
jgi:hypothetical protein